MKYWEFLIQKEGDQTWLPLETQQVEILEGRYRVVAHTDRVNAPLDIRVSQLITSEMPPRKKVRKRTSKTNETGLVVVMPYMHLKPGQWSLECSSSNVMDDLMGEGWRYGVELDVFGHTEEDWSSEWPTPTDSETVASVILDGHGPRKLAQQTRQGSAYFEANKTSTTTAANQDLPLLQAKAELEQQLKKHSEQADKPVFVSAADSDEFLSTQPAVNRQSDSFNLSSLYRVSLRQQAYLARHNQPMTIMGKVNSLVESLPEGLNTEASQLWIRLQNPENTQVIMEAHRPLSLARLPADFKVQIQLPAEVTTRVILGEVSLRTAAIDADNPSVLLTSTGFTITAGIAQLLDAVANQDVGSFEEEVSIFPAIDIDPEAKAKGGAEPEISVPALDVTNKEVVPAVGVVLPPQLVPTSLHEASPGTSLTEKNNPAPEAEDSRQPKLPTFESDGAPELPATDAPEDSRKAGEPHNALHSEPQAVTSQGSQQPAQPPMVAQPAQFIGTSILDGDLEADEIAAVLEDIDKDLRAGQRSLDTLEAPGIEGALPVGSAATTVQPERKTLYTEDSDSRQRNDSESGSSRPSRRLSDHQVEANIGFQSLKLKDQFWKKLTNLTHESHEEAVQLAKNMKAAGVSRNQALPTAPAFPMESDEVVIYDDYKRNEPAAGNTDSPARVLPSETSSSNNRLSPNRPYGGMSTAKGNFNSAFDGAVDSAASLTSTSASQKSESTGLNQRIGQSEAFSAAAAEELPEMVMPVISVPMGDLIAGATVNIVVRTRPSTYKPFIKLWMIDRQSRSLVIEPQLLTNLRPDALGDLEGSVELTVPMDCLDVQIAAIAIDMATQQESGKAVVNRHVVPASQASRSSSFKF